MEHLNKIELIGIVGRSVKKEVLENKTLVRFNMATSFVYNGNDGNPIIETTWHNNIVYWGDIELAKGDKVHIIGRLRNQAYSYEIVVNSIEKIEDDIVS